MRQMKFRFVLLPLLFLVAGVFAFAQANSELSGIVTDASGAVVSGATITLTDPATGLIKTTESGATGLYTIGALNPATYNLKVTARGFQSFLQNGVVINVSSTVRVDIRLTIGAETQTVTVEADALQVQTDSNVVNTVINSEQITEIATENRNFAALAALGLGVSSLLPDNNTPMAGAGGSSFSISANGLRQSHNIWLIDGGESDDRGGAGGMALMPPQDAIAEFNMLTSNYPPDYGISSGATFSLSLKSGTQKFHGSAYEFNRNTDYNANDYFNKFNKATPTPRSKVNYNIYGFNIGGPVVIPGLYNRNRQKTFFFVNEEWRNIKQGASTQTPNTLPTEDIPKAGTDLAYQNPAFNVDPKSLHLGIVVPDLGATSPFNQMMIAHGLTPGQPFPNDTIPAWAFDQNAVAFLNGHYLPPPATATGQAVESVPAPITVRDDIVRIDHRFTDKWQLLAHYMHEMDNDSNPKPFLGWNGDTYYTVTSTEITPSNSAAIKLSGTLSPNLLVEASMNYDGNVIDIKNSANSALSSVSGWNAQTYFNNGRNEIPSVDWGAPYNTNLEMGSAPWHNAAEDFEPKVDVSYTMGKHALKFGFSYNRYTKNQQLFGDANGLYHEQGFAGNQYTSNANQAACTAPTGGWTSSNPPPANCVQGDAIMDMLLGLAGSYDQQRAQPIRHYVNQTPSVYAMDNWHVTPRLTLQLGLRYDALPQAWERNNLIANFNPKHYSAALAPYWQGDGSMCAQTASADPTSNCTVTPGFQTMTVDGVTAPVYLNGIDLAGQGGTPRGLVSNKYGTVQPRIGFSEDLFGTGKTVVRGGFGTFFERMQGNLIYNSATVSPFSFDPSANEVNFTNPHTSIRSGATAATPFFPGGQYEMAQNFSDPAVAMYSLGVQHELSPAVVAVVQYVGNVAWHQEEYRHDNNFPLDTDPAVRAKGGSLGTYISASGNLVTLPDHGQGNMKNNSQSFRTYQGLGDITAMETNTNGSYDGLQAGVRVQNRWGFSGELDYTWSHAIDIQSGDNSCCVSNPWVIKYDKGAGQYDRRHIFNVNYVYKIPFMNHSRGVVKTVAGGWELAGTFVAESGVPVVTSFTGGGDPIGLGGGYTNRPNVSGKMKYKKNVKGWFDTSLFSVPTASWLGGPNQGFGSAHKDAVVGPGRVNFSTSLYKQFAITERAHFELRFESFNTFNHTEFGGTSNDGLNNQLNGSNFGWVNSDWGPRNLELGGKFVF